MREPEGGFLNRNFIGRDEEREKIKTRLTQDGGFLLLYGQPLVGKASLAMQVAAELREEQESTPLHVYTVDCKEAADWPGVMRAMCRAFSLDEAVANENLLVGAILRQLREKGGGKLLLLLLRLHLLPTTGHALDGLKRCLQSLAASDVVTTLLTSRRQLQLRDRERVSPLKLGDASKLLRHQAPDVTAADFEDVLRRHCHGLPPLVLQVAQMVGGGSLVAYTAEELREELEQNPDLLMQGLSEEAREFFAGLSPEVQGQVHALGDLLQGHFSLEALTAVMGVEGARMKTALRRLHDEAPLLIDNESRRMCIEPLVLHHVRRLGHVPDDPARLRVVTLLGQVLMRAERELYVAGQDRVYGHLHGDWPQLRHVLKQALHCTDHTYQAYLQVALKADKLLAKCFPNDALVFYQNMATAAVYFGTTRDQAVLQGLIGMAVTQGQGTGWKEALHYFYLALPVLQEQPRSVSYLRLLIDLGFAHFRLSHLQESDRYLSQAVSISENIQVEEDEELVFHMLRARNYLALPCLFRGNLQKSRNLLEDTLVLCEQLAPNHPDKPILINSLGLVFERSGTDQKMALHYYQQSLNERRRYAAIAPGDLVPVLNNVGMQYSRCGDYDTALKYLKEAADIRKRDNRWHYYTALTQQHIGQIYIQKGDYARAEEHLEEAARVYARCTPNHDVRAKVALCLAHLYVTEPLRDLKKTQHYLREVCELSEKIGDDLSDSGFVVLVTAIQHRMLLDSWNNATLHRSALQWMCHYEGDAQQLATHRSLLQDIGDLLHSGVPARQREDVTARVLQQCQICRYLCLTADARALWADMEQRQADHRAAMQQLRGSRALWEVLHLSGQYPPRSADGSPGLPYPSSEGMAGVPLSGRSSSGEFSPAGESKRKPERDGSDSGQLGQVIDRILNKGAVAPPAEKGWGLSGGQAQPSLPRQRSPERGAGPTHTPSWPADGAVPPQRIGAFKGNVCPPEGAVMAELGLREMPAASSHGRDSDQGFSCSFTSSDPPSTTSTTSTSTSSGSGSSEAMSVSMESSDSVSSSHPQQEVATFCERVIEIFPVQETAQDQGGSGFQGRHRGGVYATDIPGEASSSGRLHTLHPAFPSPDLHPTSELNPHPSPILPAHPSSPFLSPPVQAEHSTPSSHTASPQLTLEEVVRCAQQLMAVLPSKATAEQRMMLEKLASLSASESDSSGRALGEMALQNLKSLADQAAKLSQLHSAQASQEVLQPQTMTHAPAWPPPLPGEVTDIHSQPRVHRQRSDHRGTQPFQSVHQAPSALNLTAAQDQLEALRKTGRGPGRGEQNQSSQGSSVKDLDPEFRPNWGIQGGDSHPAQFSIKGDAQTALPVRHHLVGVAGSSPHTPHTAPSGDRPTALCDEALPEVRQQATISRLYTGTTHGSSPLLATSAGSVPSRSAGTSYGMPQIGSDRKFESGAQPEGGSDDKLYDRTQPRVGSEGTFYGRTPSQTGNVGTFYGRTPPQTGNEGTFYGRTPSQTGNVGTFYGRTPSQTGNEGTFYGRTPSQAGSGGTVDRTPPPPPSVARWPPASSISSTELFGAGRGREPTECDDDASLLHSDLSAPCGQQESPTTPRQATENDERMDRHVCTSDNCTCSLKQDQP